MNLRLNLFWILGLILAGCAAPYKPKGLMGGYSETKIQDGVYRVEFKGNSYTDKAMAQDFALLRCAEVALENGYSHFVVEDTESYYRSKVQDAGPIKAKGSVIQIGKAGPAAVGRARFADGGSASGNQAKPFSRTFHRNTIRCFKESPSNADSTVYDARQIQQNLKASYNIQK